MTQGDYLSEQEVFYALKKSVSSGTPSEEFLAYLKDLQLNRLTTGTSNRPPSFYMQCVGVMTIISKQLHNQGRHQVIRQIDMPAISPTPNFLSVIAAMCFVTHEIELTNNLGYDPIEIEAGIKTVAPKVGYVEIIVGDELVQKLSTPPPERATNSTNTTLGSTPTKREGRVIKDGRLIFIAITDDKTYPIKRLEKGGTYDKFMDYILNEENESIDVVIDEIQAIEGLRSVKNLSLLARYSGFVKPFKGAFFTVSGKEKIHFQRTALLDNGQIEAVKMLAKKV
jgi:hypothetical protein